MYRLQEVMCQMENKWFRLLHGLLKIKVSQNSVPISINHDADLNKLFPGRPQLNDNSID